MEILHVRVTDQLVGLRLDTALSRALPELSRAQIRKLIDSGHVKGPSSGKAAIKVQAGWEYQVEREEPVIAIHPQPVEFGLVHEDPEFLVIDKPAGLVVHPAVGHRDGTLVHGLLHRFGKLSILGSPDRPGIVHRLDKDTSGLLVVARTDFAYKSLTGQISDRSAVRRYRAIVCGHMTQPSGTIVAAIGRSRRDRKVMRVDRVGRAAETKYRVEVSLGPCDVVKLRLETGRTHQIRVHLRHMGKPVFGDPTYGGRGGWATNLPVEERRRVVAALKVLKRQALHAEELSFLHPKTQERLTFHSELPEDICKVLELMGS